MTIKPIRNEASYEEALKEVERLWNAERDSEEADQLEVWVTLIEAYEEANHPIPPPDPIDAILFQLEQRGLTKEDLEPLIGSRTRVWEVLNGRRQLSLSMIRRLHSELGIPADVLIRSTVEVDQKHSPIKRSHRGL